jgi:hypothetical protein
MREAESLDNEQTIARPIERVLKVLRLALSDAGIEIVRELELSAEFRRQPDGDDRRCVLLLLDCPLLLFESLALDRAAGVFLPLHVVVIGDSKLTGIHWAHPAHASGVRLPPTARQALESLYTRINRVLEHGRLSLMVH